MCGISIHNRIFLVVFLAVLGVLAVYYTPIVAELVKDPEDLLQAVQTRGHWGVLIFIGIQILQIVIPPIPGRVVQVAGGYIFGLWLGTLYLVIGAVLGSFIAFYASRLIGFPLVQAFVPPTKFERLSVLVERSETDVVFFLAFLMPAFPKDLLTYVAGLTPISGPRFVLLGILGRLPALFVSVMVGNYLRLGSYGQVALVTLVMALILLTALWNRKWIASQLGRLGFESTSADD